MTVATDEADLDGALATLHRAFPHGLVRRDGRVVGFWSTCGPDRASLVIECLGRSRGGLPVAFRIPVERGPTQRGVSHDVVPLVEREFDEACASIKTDYVISTGISVRCDFVQVLDILLANADVEQARSRAPIRFVLRDLPLITRKDDAILDKRHGADVAATFAEFRATLDPVALTELRGRCGSMALTEDH